MASGPASACSYSQMPEPVGDTSAKFLASKMVAAATFVDIALVEDDGQRPSGGMPTGIITLRSIARLKGNSPDRFTLFGYPVSFGNENEKAALNRPLEHWTTEDGRVVPHDHVEERAPTAITGSVGNAPPPPPPTTSCSPPAIQAKTGRLFLVIRDSESRLLRSAVYHPGASRPDGPVFGFVALKGEGIDYWTSAVLLATYRVPDSLGEPIHDNGLAAPGHGLLFPKSGVSLAELDTALSNAKVKPIAAIIRSGDWYDDIRPGYTPDKKWFSKALQTVAARNKRGLANGHQGFANWYNQNAQNSSWGGLDIRIAKAVVDSFYSSDEMRIASPQLYSVEVSGTPGALARLENHPIVEQMRPAARGADGKLAIPVPISVREGLADLQADTQEDRFLLKQKIDRQIRLLGDGANKAGTLPLGEMD